MWIKKTLGIIFIIGALSYLSWYIFYIRPFPFKTYKYRVPTDTLIIATEGPGQSRIVKSVLKKAFPEYKLKFSNTVPPHLIVKVPDGKNINSQWDAPYIFWSGERYGIKKIEEMVHQLQRY